MKARVGAVGRVCEAVAWAPRSFSLASVVAALVLAACLPATPPLAKQAGEPVAEASSAANITAASPAAPSARAAPASTPTGTRSPTSRIANRTPGTELAGGPTALLPPPDASLYLQALRSPAMVQGLDLSSMNYYRLDVTLSSDLAQLSGTEQIRFTNRQAVPLASVYLHLFPNLWHTGMRVFHMKVEGQPVQPALESANALVRVPLSVPLAPGATTVITLSFSDPIPANGSVGAYGEFANLGGVVALAHFYPTVAAYDAGGWHLETPAKQGDVLYNDASLYDVTLTAPSELTVVATGATVGRVEQGNGTATWRLAGGPMRDFNFAASAQYLSASAHVGEVLVNSYFLPGDAAGGTLALEWAADALRVYEAQFGPYPYGELDLAETATSAGGIEYPGMVVVAANLYSDPDRRDFFESATVHEVAHQWWYNVVGNDQVNAPWLDEALAQYSTYLYFRTVYGDAGERGFVGAMRERWARVDYAERPIGLPVSAYQGREYGAIVYGRGPLFLLALRDRIGEARMAKLLRQYYTENAWRVATPAGFHALGEKVSGQDLSALFKQWVYPP